MKMIYGLFLLTGAFVSSSQAFDTFKRKPAFFKHYTQDGMPREIMTLYDIEGNPVRSYETTHTPEDRTVEDWWYSHWQKSCTDEFPHGQIGWWQIPDINEVLIIKHTPLAGITDIQYRNTLRPLSGSTPMLQKSVIKRLLIEAQIVKYCSVFKRSVKGELANNFPAMDIDDLLDLLKQSIKP